LNIVKTGFFIFLKGFKSSSVFTNFYYSFYKDDFFIFISVRLLKVKFNKFNVLEEVISKPGLYKSKDCHRFEVLKGINIGNTGFKDLRSWESIEGMFRMSEDKLCEPVES